MVLNLQLKGSSGEHAPEDNAEISKTEVYSQRMVLIRKTFKMSADVNISNPRHFFTHQS